MCSRLKRCDVKLKMSFLENMKGDEFDITVKIFWGRTIKARKVKENPTFKNDVFGIIIFRRK